MRSTLSIFSLILLLLAISLSPVHALAPPVELHLNTVIEPVATFVLDENDILITLGDDYTVGYELTGNVPLRLKITSDNTVGNKYYMIHENAPAITDKIQYILKFDYGTGSLSTVNPLNFKNMTTSTHNGSLRIETNSNAGDNLPEGEYLDTITFNFEAQ